MEYGIESRVTGLLLGTAVGDSLGLPGERLSRESRARDFPGPLRQSLLFGHGMIGDNTEMTIMTAQSVLSSGGDVESFLLSFSWRLRYWLLFLRFSWGWATLRAAARLWTGVSFYESGVASAGNGAAVRSAVLGALFPDPIERREFVRLGTKVTHRDPRAFHGALAVAEMAALALVTPAGQKPSLDEVCTRLRVLVSDSPKWQKQVDRMEQGWKNDVSVADFAASLGLADGITSHVFHTVPVAIFGWYRHYGDMRETLNSVIRCGGDTDSVGAIAGALAGASVGADEIPSEYLDRLTDYPYGVKFLRRLGTQLARFSLGIPATTVPAAFWAVPLRNLVFDFAVLVQLFRRAGLALLNPLKLHRK